MNVKAGTQVLIVDDGRPLGAAAGQIGTYEGDFPRSVTIFYDGEYQSCSYEWWVQSDISTIMPTIEEHLKSPLAESRPKREDFGPADDDEGFNRWWEACNEWARQNGVRYYYINNNPRIRLADGSVIWGDECWWGKAEDAPPLTEAQQELEDFKGILRSLVIP